jgi:hypothetical protein
MTMINTPVSERSRMRAGLPYNTRNPELLDRFFAEARAVNLIRHESIVSVIDMAQLPDGRPYHFSEDIVDQSMGWVRDLVSVRPDRPFFLYLPHFGVHSPHQAKPDLIAHFKNKPAFNAVNERFSHISESGFLIAEC